MDLKATVTCVTRMIGIGEETISTLAAKGNLVTHRNPNGKTGAVCNVKCMGFCLLDY